MRVCFATFAALSCLLFFTCQRPTARVVGSTPAPPATQPRFQDSIPIVDEGRVIGPDVAAGYAPTIYQPLPTSDRRTPPPLPTAANQCDFVGEVWDFTGQDGCGLLVETTDGSLFNVAGLPQGYFLEGGTRIRFGFSYVEDGASVCMHEDAIIRITCMQLLRESSGFPYPIVCEVHKEPSEWIHELIQDLGALYVTRFPWRDERNVYLFETAAGQYLYDCRGFLLCQPKKNCLQFIEDFSQGELIYEG